jgi:hypothetical protein
MMKKHMVPLSKGGQTTAHKGKGSQMASMPNRSAISQLSTAPGAAINNYAKATPMPQPSPSSAPGIGTGDWSGGGYGGP